MTALDTPADLEALEAPGKPVKSASTLPKQKRGRPTGPDSFLPRVFDSMSQCSSATGIPISFLKQAKTADCAAFRHGRVDLVEFLRWRFGQPEDAVEDWGAELQRYRALRERIKLDSDQQRVIDRSAVQTALAKGMALLFQKIDNEFGLMLPPALRGLPEVEIQKRLLEAAETFKSTLRDELQALAASTPNVDAEKSDQSIQQK
jgi:hypothetical protein